MKSKHLLLALGLMGTLASCDRLLDFEPGDVILAEDAIRTEDDLQRLLVSTYDVLGNLYGGRLQVVNELRGDNFAAPNNSLDFTSVYNRETTFFTGINGGVYSDLYRAIYRANVVIERFDFVDELSDAGRTRMEAEARFVRAVSHFAAVRMFAQPYGYTADNSHLGVPLRLNSSQTPAPRSSVGDVYAAIVDDLAYAAENLPTANGVYATKSAAEGFLAMVYFQMGDYPAAAQYADAVISSGLYEMDDDLDRFEADVINPEMVFGIVGRIQDNRSTWFRDNLRNDNNPSPQLSLSEDFQFFLSLSGAGDARNQWVTSSGGRYLCNRFNEKEYFNVPVIHLTLMKLVRAESLAEVGGDLSVAIGDINDIRDRAFGAGNFPLSASASAAEVLAAARDEFRKETVCEGWWTDHLVRRGAAGENITIRGAAWDCPGMALQFPNSETTAAGFVLNEEGGCL
jgi:hypothetical protein